MQKLFDELRSYDGRFSRFQYWTYSIGINIVGSIPVHLIELIPNGHMRHLVTALISVPLIYFSVCVQIKRSHDLGKAGSFVWLTLIPIVNLYPLILFAFVRGTVGNNEYGTDPVT